METLKYHPLCRLLPAMPEDELDRLVEDIRANGLREPITILNGEILDGRSRLAACRMAGVEPRFVQFDGASAAAFVASMNLHRRHLSASQRAAVAAELAEAMECEAAALVADEYAFPAETTSTATENRVFPEENTSGPIGPEVPAAPKPAPRRPKKSKTAEAAKEADATERSAKRARRVMEAAPELHQAVKAGEITLHAAEKQIAQPKPAPVDPVAAKRASILETLAPLEREIRHLADLDPAVDRAKAIESLGKLIAAVKGKNRRVSASAKDETDRQVEAIYAAYPRRVGKGQAVRAITAALKIATYDVLMEAVEEYAGAKAGEDPQFIPHPATWFNGRRWEDDRADWRVRGGPKPLDKLAALDDWTPEPERLPANIIEIPARRIHDHTDDKLPY